MNQANTLWWNCFSVLDVLLLLFYSQLKDDLSPKAVFYINNIIWFLGLDIYHLLDSETLDQGHTFLKGCAARDCFLPKRARYSGAQETNAYKHIQHL